MTRFVVFGSILVAAACFGIAFAGPIGQRNDKVTTAETSSPSSALEITTTAVGVVDTLTTGDETAVATVDETGLEAAGNETHIRQKRSCGCCCCRPCCCCCKPCCCCCRCCCCRCCCCCCRPCCCCCCKPCCCCCCKPCCCCCRPCCGCCGCGGGRKRRSIQLLSHKLMDKQAAIIRAEADSSAEIATTVAQVTPEATTDVIFTNANIDAFGRRYSDLAFADFRRSSSQESFNNDFYNRQL